MNVDELVKSSADKQRFPALTGAGAEVKWETVGDARYTVVEKQKTWLQAEAFCLVLGDDVHKAPQCQAPVLPRAHPDART